MLDTAQASARRTTRPRPANRETRAHRLRDGRLMGYAEYGDPEGWPVLVLHGTPGSRLMFRLGDNAAAERGLRLIAPDRPGYGLSSPHVLKGVSGWTGDATELTDALGLERFVVVGVSGGAPYAAACAARFAERVVALALVSPVGPLVHGDQALDLTPEHRFIFRRLPSLPWASGLTFQAMRIALSRTPALCHQGIVRRAAECDRGTLLRPEIRANLLECLYEGLRNGVEGARQDLRLFGKPWDFDLSLITARTCVWHGAEDGNVPAAGAERLAASIPGAELRRCANAGHYWVFAHFRKVLDWIGGRIEALAP